MHPTTLGQSHVGSGALGGPGSPLYPGVGGGGSGALTSPGQGGPNYNLNDPNLSIEGHGQPGHGGGPGGPGGHLRTVREVRGEGGPGENGEDGFEGEYDSDSSSNQEFSQEYQELRDIYRDLMQGPAGDDLSANILLGSPSAPSIAGVDPNRSGLMLPTGLDDSIVSGASDPIDPFGGQQQYGQQHGQYGGAYHGSKERTFSSQEYDPYAQRDVSSHRNSLDGGPVAGGPQQFGGQGPKTKQSGTISQAASSAYKSFRSALGYNNPTNPSQSAPTGPSTPQQLSLSARLDPNQNPRLQGLSAKERAILQKIVESQNRSQNPPTGPAMGPGAGMGSSSTGAGQQQRGTPTNIRPGQSSSVQAWERYRAMQAQQQARGSQSEVLGGHQMGQDPHQNQLQHQPHQHQLALQQQDNSAANSPGTQHRGSITARDQERINALREMSAAAQQGRPGPSSLPLNLHPQPPQHTLSSGVSGEEDQSPQTIGLPILSPPAVGAKRTKASKKAAQLQAQQAQLQAQQIQQQQAQAQVQHQQQLQAQQQQALQAQQQLAHTTPPAASSQPLPQLQLGPDGQPVRQTITAETIQLYLNLRREQKRKEEADKVAAAAQGQLVATTSEEGPGVTSAVASQQLARLPTPQSQGQQALSAQAQQQALSVQQQQASITPQQQIAQAREQIAQLTPTSAGQVNVRLVEELKRLQLTLEQQRLITRKQEEERLAAEERRLAAEERYQRAQSLAYSAEEKFQRAQSVAEQLHDRLRQVTGAVVGAGGQSGQSQQQPVEAVASGPVAPGSGRSPGGTRSDAGESPKIKKMTPAQQAQLVQLQQAQLLQAQAAAAAAQGQHTPQQAAAQALTPQQQAQQAAYQAQLSRNQKNPFVPPERAQSPLNPFQTPVGPVVSATAGTTTAPTHPHHPAGAERNMPKTRSFSSLYGGAGFPSPPSSPVPSNYTASRVGPPSEILVPHQPGPGSQQQHSSRTASHPQTTSGSNPKNFLTVRVLNGVSGEQHSRFSIPLAHLFPTGLAPQGQTGSAVSDRSTTILDQFCARSTGFSLKQLHWLTTAVPEGKPDGKGSQLERRKADSRMLDDVTASVRDALKQERDGATPQGPHLLLCTIPLPPPVELPIASGLRVKRMNPSTITLPQAHDSSSVAEVKITLETTRLEDANSSTYSVAFTDQWTNQSFYTEISRVLPSRKGVEFAIPLHQMTHSVYESGSVLYDVHLVVNSSKRSENRRALTLIAANETLDTSSIATSEPFDNI